MFSCWMGIFSKLSVLLHALSALFFEGFPQLSSLKPPVSCGISLACRPGCVGFVQILNVNLAQEPCIDYFWLVFHSQAILHFSLLLFYFLHSSSCRLRHCFQEGLELGMNMLKNTVMLVSGITALAYLHSYLHLHEHLWFFLSCQVREQKVAPLLLYHTILLWNPGAATISSIKEHWEKDDTD